MRLKKTCTAWSGWLKLMVCVPLVCLGIPVFGSGPFTIKPDTTVCEGDLVQFYVDEIDSSINGTTSYSVNSIPFTPEPFAGTSLFLGDDNVVGPFSIGFNFCFYGVTYSQFYLCTNGWISFSPTAGGSGWEGNWYPDNPGDIIPNTNANIPKAAILGPWQDWNFSGGGAIYYQTTGVAPNRKLVVTYENVPMFSCSSEQGNFQIVLNETTNTVESFIQDKPSCPSWGSNWATHGLHNHTGTQATIVNGRNATSWTATNEGWEFIPGGTAGYQVDWFVGGSQVGSGENITLTANANMEVVGRITYNCSGTMFYDTVNVSANPAPTYTVTSTPPSCIGTSNGLATVNVTSGSSPFQYLWNTTPPQSTATATGLGAGSYTVTITDDEGCMVDTTINLNAPPALVTNATLTTPSCWNSGDGEILISSPNGTPPLTFQWSNGTSSNPAINLEAGTFMVTVTDANGCTAVDTITLMAPPQLTFTLNRTNISCNGAEDGTISASFSGGTPSYSLQWSTGQSGLSINNLPPGNYTATLTDNNGCQRVAFTNISQPPAINLSLAINHVNCNGSSTGSASASASGGTGTFSYSWSTGSSTNTIINRPAGSYTVTVTDGNNCSRDSTIAITEPPVLLDSLTIVQPACGGTLGSVTAHPYGGAPGYSYNWSNGQTSQTITNLGGGSYIVTITDANSCTKLDTAVLANPGNISGAVNAYQVSCNGGTDGALAALPSGGTTPYSYAWSTGHGSDSISGLTAGTYMVTVTDASGCTWQDTVTLTEPTALQVSFSITDVSCAGGSDGSATLSASGGTPAYQYVWSNGPTGTANGSLTSGTYAVTITDAQGCVLIDSAVVSQPAPLSSSLSITDATCTGANGSIAASISGGSPNYNYTWSNGPASPSNNNLVAGTYYLTVTDNQGCTLYDTATVASLPGNLSISLSSSSEVCVGQNGTAWVTPTGGSGPYTYAWSNGGSLDTIKNLNSGNYIVTVTDASSCTAIDSVMVSNDPGSLTVSMSSTPTICTADNGSVSASPAGGSGPYTYSWSGGQNGSAVNGLSAGTFIVTLTDNNGCSVVDSALVTQTNDAITLSLSSSPEVCTAGNGSAQVAASGGTTPYGYAWSNGGTIDQIQNVSSGTYYVTVTDVNGCSNLDSIVVGNDPGNLSVSLNATAEICGGSNGSVSVVPAGGSAPFNYNWSNGGSGSSLTSLSAGMFVVTVTDNNGCIAIDSVPITNDPGNLSVSLTATPEICGGGNGSVTANPSGGTSPYTYTWSNGGGSSGLSNLAAGMYIVTVSDVNGCLAVDSVPVANDPGSLSISMGGVDVSCSGAMDGMAEVVVLSGNGPFLFQWNTGGSNDTLINLGSGSYIVTVTDATSCEASDTITLMEPSAINVAFQPTSVSCYNSQDGSITATASGGVAPYQYDWSNGGSGQSVSNLGPGMYTLTITDANNCQLIDSQEVQAPVAIATQTDEIAPSCFGLADGTAWIQVSGGTPGYSYQWSGGQQTDTITNQPAGQYFITVTDQSGCTQVDSVTLVDPAQIGVGFTTIDPSCNQGVDGSITANGSGGVGVLQYDWSTGQSGAVLSGLPAGTYSVTVTDQNACAVEDSATLTNPPGLVLSIDHDPEICNGNNGKAWVTAGLGAGTPYTYQWSTGGVQDTINSISAGSYTVTVFDAAGCTESISVNVTLNSGSLTASSTPTNVSCNGGNDGRIVLQAGGGAANPVTYNWNTGVSNDTIEGIPAGTYYYTVTDGNNCQVIDSASITEPPPVAVNAQLTNVSCAGQSDGSILLTGYGGVAPYDYLWSNGSNGGSLSNLAAGAYSVTITDQAGCTLVEPYSLTEPPALSVVLSGNDISCNGGSDGSLTAAVNGGTPGFSYDWNNGMSGASLQNLVAGFYRITVTDGSNCTALDTLTLTEPEAINLSLSAGESNCSGGATGYAKVEASGGQGGLQYQWSNGATNDSIGDLTPGWYTVTVTDLSGCSEVDSVEVVQPSAVQVNLTVNPVLCHGDASGSINAAVSGGTPGYSYNWSVPGNGSSISGLTAGSYGLTVTDASGCVRTESAQVTEPEQLQIDLTPAGVSCAGGADGAIITASTGGINPYGYSWSNGFSGAVVTNLTGGQYWVTLTDDNGCITVDSAMVTEPTAISLSISIQDVSCFGANDGLISVNASGGAGNFTYAWSGGVQGSVRNNLNPGSYSLTVTDGNGCSQTADPAVSEPLPISVQVITTDAICTTNNGIATAQVSGGTPAYQYNWNNGGQTDSIQKLVSGVYTVTVTDDNGCTESSSGSVGVTGSLNANINPEDVSCFGANDGQAAGLSTNGYAPYQYKWSTGSTDSIVTALGPGVYGITITDQFGCTDSAEAVISEPDQIVIQLSSSDPACYGTATGSISTQVAGGIGPYTFMWTGGSSDSNLTDLEAGGYTLTLTDSNGCVLEDSALLVDPPPINVEAGPEQVIQEGTTIQLQASITPSGSYTYSWLPSTHVDAPGSQVTTATPDQTTIYTIVATDPNGCTGEDTVRIVVKPPVNLFIPNAFSPNGDGNNDLFRIVGGPFDFFHLRVYNRWGNLVFESEDETEGWDGRFEGVQQGTATYVYVVTAQDEFGKPFEKRGNLILLR